MHAPASHRRAGQRTRAHIGAAALIALCGAGPVVADTGPPPSMSEANLTDSDRFGRYEDSYAIWNVMRNNGWASRDDSAARVHYSLKYSVCGPRVDRAAKNVTPASAPASAGATSADGGDRADRAGTAGTAGSTPANATADAAAKAPAAGDTPAPPQAPAATAGASTAQLCRWLHLPQDLELFAAYTGEFDFYAGTRPSGPVINRLSIPGVYVRLPLRALRLSDNAADSVELGWQHRSDGQTTEVTDAADARRAQRNYDERNRPFFDTISRGANYFSVALDSTSKGGSDKAAGSGIDYTARVKLKLYTGAQDAALTWGPLAGSGRRFSDYDRLTLTGAVTWQPLTVSLEWRLGDKGLATDSQTLGVQWDLLGLPFYLRLHRGPMNTLSNYAQRQDSIGVGLRFARF